MIKQQLSSGLQVFLYHRSSSPIHRVFDLLSICLSVPFLSFWILSFCFSVFLSFCLFVSLSFCLSVFLSFCLSVLLSFCHSVFLSFCISVSLSSTFAHRPYQELFTLSIFFVVFSFMSLFLGRLQGRTHLFPSCCVLDPLKFDNLFIFI